VFPYWLLFFSFAAGSFSNSEEVQRQRHGLMLRLAAILAIVMVGFRYRVGGDWFAYSRTFTYIGMLDLPDLVTVGGSDPGYSLVNWIAAQLGAGVWLVNLVCGAALIAGIYRIAVRQPNAWLVFVVAVPYLITVVGMGYTRQAAAIGFSLLAITSLFNGHLARFLFLMFLAVMFHQTAVLLLPIIGLARSENRTLSFLLAVVLAAALYHYFSVTRFELMQRNYLGEQMTSSGATIRLIMNALPAAILLLQQRHFRLPEQELKVWRMYSLASIVAVAALPVVASSTVVDRLALYLIPLQLVVLGRVPWVFGSNQNVRLMLTTAVVIYSAAIQFVFLNYAVNADGWVPYQFYPLAT
jgi:hypothetical protein